MNYLEIKYISFLSPQLRNFKKISENKFNFSCPLCGDSKRNPRKARGDIYDHEGKTFFHCHKCGKSRPFELFLKEIDNTLFYEYLKEKLYNPKKEKVEISQKTTTPPVFYDIETFKDLKSIDDLFDQDICKQYVVNRKIPEEYYNLLFRCDKFYAFTNTLIPGKFVKNLPYDGPRLVIPLFDENKKLIGYSGRSLEANPVLRYINIYLREDKPKLYGLDRWNKSNKTYIVEGPLDSLFLKNCMATMGADMVSVLKDLNKEQFVLVYDNEPRSKTTKAKIKKAIDHGYSVCIWPKNIEQKDINEMILSGMTEKDIQNIIKDNTFQGLSAGLQLMSKYCVGF